MANKKFEALDGINSDGAVVIGNTVTISGNLAINTDTLVVDVSQENVGVNTSPSSAYALDVSGNMRATTFYGDGSNLTNLPVGDADTIDGIGPGSFLRSDVSDSYDSGGTLSITNSSLLEVSSGGIRINDSQSIGFGSSGDVTFSYNGLILNVGGKDISFDDSTLYIDVSANSIGVNTAPVAGYALDVNGTMKANGVRLNNNQVLRFGSTSNVSFTHNGTRLNVTGTDISFENNTLLIDVSAHSIGVNATPAAGYALDVNGNMRASAFYGDGSNLTGVPVGDASTLDGIGSGSFLRSDVTDTHNNGVLVFGAGSSGARFNDSIPLRFGNGETPNLSDVTIAYNASVDALIIDAVDPDTKVRVDQDLYADRDLYINYDSIIPSYRASIVNGVFYGSSIEVDGAYITGNDDGIRIEGQANADSVRARTYIVAEGNLDVDGNVYLNKDATGATGTRITNGTYYGTALNVTGSITKGSGTFKIDHPIKPETHFLYHSFIEGPQADNIYRGKVTLENGEASINLDQHFNMTEGTFAALNRNVDVFTSNEDTWCSVKGKVVGNILTISCETETSNATVSWMVVGERQDKFILESDMTDDQGRLILEVEKDEPPPEP